LLKRIPGIKNLVRKGFARLRLQTISLQEINYEGHMFVKIPEIKKRADNEE